MGYAGSIALAMSKPFTSMAVAVDNKLGIQDKNGQGNSTWIGRSVVAVGVLGTVAGSAAAFSVGKSIYNNGVDLSKMHEGLNTDFNTVSTLAQSAYTTTAGTLSDVSQKTIKMFDDIYNSNVMKGIEAIPGQIKSHIDGAIGGVQSGIDSLGNKLDGMINTLGQIKDGIAELLHRTPKQ